MQPPVIGAPAGQWGDWLFVRIAARSRAGLTQNDVAQRMGTTQSVIARLEGGKTIPSMRTVQRYAQAVGARAVVRIEPQAEHA